MNIILPKIYPITDARLSGISHAEQVERLLKGGARFIQLREKQASPREFYAAAEAVIAGARKKGVNIIINDRVDIAMALKADGVHLGQDDLPPEKVRVLLGDDAIIGYSTHSVDQARAAIELPVDYIAIGPIFHTPSKLDPDPTVGLDGLGRVRDAVGNLPLVAIGGITLENIAAVFAAGADSVAMIGALVADFANITRRMGDLVRLYEPP